MMDIAVSVLIFYVLNIYLYFLYIIFIYLKLSLLSYIVNKLSKLFLTYYISNIV